jgi:hypothetical protein
MFSHHTTAQQAIMPYVHGQSELAIGRIVLNSSRDSRLRLSLFPAQTTRPCVPYHSYFSHIAKFVAPRHCLGA